MRNRVNVLFIMISLFLLVNCKKDNGVAPEPEVLYQADIWSALQGGMATGVVAGTPVYRWMTFVNTTWEGYIFPVTGVLDTLMLGNNRYGVIEITPSSSTTFIFDLCLTGEPGMQSAINVPVAQDSMLYSPVDYSDAGDMRMQFGVKIVGEQKD